MAQERRARRWPGWGSGRPAWRSSRSGTWPPWPGRGRRGRCPALRPSGSMSRRPQRSWHCSRRGCGAGRRGAWPWRRLSSRSSPRRSRRPVHPCFWPRSSRASRRCEVPATPDRRPPRRRAGRTGRDHALDGRPAGALGCFAIKLAGLSVPARVLESPRVERIGALLPIALLAALTATQTFATAQRLTIDARAAGLAVALVAVSLRAPFLVVVVLAAVTTRTPAAAVTWGSELFGARCLCAGPGTSNHPRDASRRPGSSRRRGSPHSVRGGDVLGGAAGPRDPVAVRVGQGALLRVVAAFRCRPSRGSRSAAPAAQSEGDDPYLHPPHGEHAPLGPGSHLAPGELGYTEVPSRYDRGEGDRQLAAGRRGCGPGQR